MPTLTGPVLLPNGTPMSGAQVNLRLVAGGSRTPAHVTDHAVAGVASTETDEVGDFTLTVAALPTDDPVVYPPAAYYEVVIGGGRWPKYLWKVKPTSDQTYVFTDPSIGGETEDLLPPEFVQVTPTITLEDVAAQVAAYFVAFPIDVTDEVAAALLADPPLTVALNGTDITDDAAFRLAIGAAGDSDTAAVIAALAARVGALELVESTNPAIRDADVDGALVTAPNHTTATVDVVDGAIAISLT